MIALIALGVDSSINEVDKEVSKIQHKEIPILWKERLLQKLENVKKKIEKLKTEPLINEPEGHPLKNSLILKTVVDYLDAPSERSSDSFDTLKTLRGVCKEWNDLVTPRVMIKSKINLLTSLHDCIETFDDSAEVIEAAFSNSDKTSLVIETPELLDTEDITGEWLEDLLQENGNKFIGLTVGKKHSKIRGAQEYYDKKTLYPILLKANLDELNLYDFALQPIETSSVPHQYPENIQKLNVKHVRVILSEFCDGDDSVAGTIEILLLLERLESLSLCLNYDYGYGKDWVNFFTTVQSKDTEMFKNLSRLELLKFVPRIKALEIMNQLEFPNLKHLRIQVIVEYNIGRLLPFLELVGPNLETLNIIVDGKTCRTRSSMGRVCHTMSKLEVFEYSYSLCDDYCDYENGDPLPLPLTPEYWNRIVLPLTFSASKIIRSMPALKHWKVMQSKLTNVPDLNEWKSKVELRKNFTFLNCGNGLCTHAEELLEMEDKEKSFHGCLEKLEFSCSFREADLISRMASLFPNIKELSIGIKSTLLNEFFLNLIPLDKLKMLKIALIDNVEDFPIAINSNLPKFKNLKELILEKCSRQPINSDASLEEYQIFRVDEAHTGFSECDSLDILSFKNMKIDPTELNKLQAELLKSKPKLALNVSFTLINKKC